MTATAVKARPILFSGEMVRAILERRKTQTRRLSGLKMVNERPDQFTHATVRDDGVTWDFWYGADSYVVRCPYGQPGDRLWVRETWQQVRDIDGKRFTVNSTQRCQDARVVYSATLSEEEPPTWRPSIHMPRWASRITLEVTVVRVERLQEIESNDVYAEGFPVYDYDEHALATAREYKMAPLLHQFACVWDRLNVKRGYPWESNPWVWVVSFKRIGAEG